MLISKCPNCQAPMTPREVEAARCPNCGAALAGEARMGEPAPYDRPAPRAAATARGGKGTLSLLFSILALLLSIAAFCFAFFSDPFGIALLRYDFSTPQASMKSQLQMQENRDVRAVIAYQHRHEGDLLREKIKTLTVEEEVEGPKGKKILFVKFQRDGKDRYEVASFEQDSKSKVWKNAYLSEYSKGVSPELQKKMGEWKKKNPLGDDDAPF